MKDDRDIEKLLERFSPNPAPPGLRGRVLQTVEREAKARRILTPAWRWALATSLVLLAVFMLADWQTTSVERNRLSSLLDAHGVKAPTPVQAAEQAAAEILASMPDLDPGSRQALTQSILRDQGVAARSRKAALRLTEEINEY